MKELLSRDKNPRKPNYLIKSFGVFDEDKVIDGFVYCWKGHQQNAMDQFRLDLKYAI